MVEADILGAVIEKLVSPAINLSPYPVLDVQGGVKLFGLDADAMRLSAYQCEACRQTSLLRLLWQLLQRPYYYTNGRDAGRIFGGAVATVFGDFGMQFSPYSSKTRRANEWLENVVDYIAEKFEKNP